MKTKFLLIVGRNHSNYTSPCVLPSSEAKAPTWQVAHTSTIFAINEHGIVSQVVIGGGLVPLPCRRAIASWEGGFRNSPPRTAPQVCHEGCSMACTTNCCDIFYPFHELLQHYCSVPIDNSSFLFQLSDTSCVVAHLAPWVRHGPCHRLL